MSEDTSLTDAVKQAAGISLTEAVKGVAGRKGWFVDADLETRNDAIQGAARRRAMRLLALCARLAAFAVLTITFMQATSTVLDAERPLPAAAHTRVALVVGNSAYQYTPELENPKNDATDVSVELKKLGFRVIEGFDLGKAAFDAKLRDFSTALQGAEVGLFFYAGHGVQVSGHNYLVPVDAKLSTASALDFEMVRLDLVQQAMEQEAKTNLLFFDASRDNPLARTLARAMGTRSAEVGRGLAAVGSNAGTLISFSTQPGHVAFDGAGRNSPFSGALVRQLRTSNDDLSAMLIAIRNDVMRQTDRKQVPWEHSALTGRFYFNEPAEALSPPPGMQLKSSEAAEAWSATKDTENFAVLDAFVARYRGTFFAELARARIEKLQKQMTTSIPSRPPAGATPMSPQ
jgi:uncharacterized caspase-like protein